MKFDVGGRAGGKTYRALEWMVENPNGVVMVAYETHRHNYLQAAKHRFGEEWVDANKSRVITVNTRDTLRGRARNYKLAIDDLDLVLPALFNMEVDYVTGTGAVRHTTVADNPHINEHVRNAILSREANLDY